MPIYKIAIASLAVVLTAGCYAEWKTLDCESEPTARHEAGFIAFEGKAYLLGGRRINPVDIYDPSTNSWSAGAESPIEIHHFQPVVHDGAIWIVGAMTGPYPNEKPVDRVLKYIPNEDRWEWGIEIPEERRRGGAGVVIDGDTLYLCAGITRGHMGGFVPWLDSLDLATGKWEVLPDAPTARDHFQSTMIGDRIYLAGGRQTSREDDQVFNRTIAEVDVFEVSTKTWSTIPQPLPTPRAGSTTHAAGQRVIVVGGESDTQNAAHSEVEAYDLDSNQWLELPSLNRGRHGTGFAEIDGVIYTSSGSGNRGGGPELTDIESIPVEELRSSER